MAQKNIDLSKYTVLAVDDIPMNLLLISKILTRLNINVKTAANGREALDMIEKERPSLVLLDLMMPEIDGYEVLTRLRSNPATEDLRIIILSALNSNEDIVKGFNLGANDFITKPIILEKLTSCVVTQLQLVEAGN
ncbi:MAG: response regulator [Bacteroidaceae bacterium]|nr:response regulator [Bacteroidaceae bacterium]